MKRYRGYKLLTVRDAVALVALLATLTVAFYAEAAFDKAAAREPEIVEATVEESSVVEETITQSAAQTAPFTQGSLETALLYNVPLDADLQLHIIRLCEQYHIEPSVVMAMIERESNFRAGVLGDSGKSYGLMQIQARWHEERMERLGVTDLLDPYQNVLVGIDYLAELCERYECIGMALMAYNAGPSGAKSNYWDKGIFESKYSSGVLERSEELTEGMVEYVLD